MAQDYEELEGIDYADQDNVAEDAENEVKGLESDLAGDLGVGSLDRSFRRKIRRRIRRSSRKAYNRGRGRGAKKAMKTAADNSSQSTLALKVAANLDRLEDEDAVKAFRNKKVKAYSHKVYSTKLANSETNIKFFEPSDKKYPGLSNVDGGKLEKGQPVLVTHIEIAHSIAPTADDGGIVKAPFTHELHPSVVNAEMELKLNGKLQVCKNTSVGDFKRANTAASGTVSYLLELAEPVWAETQTEIDLELNMKGTGNNAADNYSVVRVGLVGAQLRA